MISRRASYVCGTHFFNASAEGLTLKLLEVVRAASTSDATMTTVMELSRLMGKTAVVCTDSFDFTPSCAYACDFVPALSHVIVIEMRHQHYHMSS